MINLNNLNKFRNTSLEVVEMYGSTGNQENGVFHFGSNIDGAEMRVVAAIGMGWEHVSVSRKNRCPNWPEMEYIRKLFFRPDETVMQLHVPEEEHINCHANCLHMWRPIDQEIPQPPSIMVGLK